MSTTYRRPYRRNPRQSPLTDPWRDKAYCATLPPEEQEQFFPPHGVLPGEVAATKALCRERCPVREACLAYAIEHNEYHGIWGGTSPDDRRKLRRKWRELQRKRRAMAQAS